MSDKWESFEGAPKSTPLLVALIRDGKIWRVSDAIRTDLGFYTINGGSACHWRTHWTSMPDPPSEEPTHERPA